MRCDWLALFLIGGRSVLIVGGVWVSKHFFREENGPAGPGM
jgi:hypothetical protein